MSALLLILMLVALIVVHELGHFFAAKISKVKVEEFGIGYPPRAFTLGRIGATVYTLNWLPFGGFVKLLEEDGPEAIAKTGARGSFAAASAPKKALILVAGVVMNVLAGWALFAGGLMAGMPIAVDPSTPGARLVIAAVIPGSPAEASGLKGGDTVLSIGTGTARAQTTPEGVSAFIASRAGKSIDVTYVRAGATSTVEVVPAHAIIPGEAAQPAIGVQLTMIADTALSPLAAMGKAVSLTTGSLLEIMKSLGSLVAGAFTGEGKLSSLVGPVGLTSVVGDAAGQGAAQFAALAAFISLNLAIINLIPIPALDGGRLVFVLVEALMRRRIPTIITQILNTVGFLAIIILMAAVTIHDIARLAQ